MSHEVTPAIGRDQDWKNRCSPLPRRAQHTRLPARPASLTKRRPHLRGIWDFRGRELYHFTAWAAQGGAEFQFCISRIAAALVFPYVLPSPLFFWSLFFLRKNRPSARGRAGSGFLRSCLSAHPQSARSVALCVATLRIRVGRSSPPQASPGCGGTCLLQTGGLESVVGIVWAPSDSTLICCRVELTV